MLTQQQKLIEEGINYLKAMKSGITVKELVEQLAYGGTHVSEEHVKEAIKAARQHKDAAMAPPKVVVATPLVKVHRDLRTGAFQAIQEVQVELQKEIIIRYGEEVESEFFALLPVKITVKRK